MMTATEAIQRDDETRQRRMFEDMIEHFTKTYRPQDRYEAAEFDRMLFTLVRQIYRDAQQPLLDQITKMAMAMPNPIFNAPR